MILVRGFAFVLSLLLAAAMVIWQVNHLREDISAAFNPPALFAMMALGLGILAMQGIAYSSMGKKPRLLVLAVGGALALPVTVPVASVLSLIQLRSGNHRRIWTSVLSLGVMLGMNVMLPLAIGALLVGGGGGLMTGWVAVKLQFFLVVDYFLARAILYYFNSGASAFVSLRYLRRRILSLLAVLGIGLGVLVLIVVNSIMTGFQTDFREQMRGSLSHLLVRFSSEDIQFRLNQEELAQRRWAEYVKRIEASEGMADDWAMALDRAMRLYREVDKDGLPDPADWLNAQPPLPPDPDDEDDDDKTVPGDLSEDEKAFLERLRTGEGLTDFDRECLRDEADEIVAPRQFYLRRVGDPETAAAEIRLSWYSPVFRQALHREFEKAEKALGEHRDPQGRRDVEGVSWRVSTKTFITPKSGSRELPIAELVGVDPEREPTISNLGEYVATAELTEFRDQYALQPMLNILGATLGWETTDSLATTEAEPLFLYNETGENMSRTMRLPRDMTRYLAVRRFTTASGRVRWRSFDNVQFHEFSPARKIYERVREAHKDASRTDDLVEVGEILRACDRDLRTILLPYLRDYDTSERHQQVNQLGAKVIYFNYLTGYDASVDAVDLSIREFVSWIKETLADETISEAENELLNDLWNDLTALAREARDDVRNLDMSESDRETRLRKLAGEYRERIQRALDAATADDLPVRDFLAQLLAYSHNPEDLQPLRKRMELRESVPISYAVEHYSEASAHVQARMRAYREVLPVRTAMRTGETRSEYLKRARERVVEDDGMPGIILGDALAENALGRDVNIGDQIAITIPRIYREDGRLMPRTTEVWFKVTGLFRSGLYEENAGRMYCDFEALTRILADSETRYIVGARLSDYRPYEGQMKSDALKADVREELENHRVNYLSVGVWEDETRTLLEAVNIERTLIGLIVSLIIFLAGGAIVIIVYQLVNEKVKDIGILKALGHSPWGIRSVFMFNALFIGLFGAIGGATLGILVSEYLNEIEDFVDRVFHVRLFPPDIYFLTYIPSVQGAELIWLAIDIAVPVVMFGFFCGILPSMAAARKDPVEALHYE